MPGLETRPLEQTPREQVTSILPFENEPREKLETMSQTVEFLKSIEGEFLTDIEDIARRKNPYWGFQRVEKAQNGITVKHSVHANSEGAEFLAENWCTVSSAVLARGLRERFGPNMQARFISLNAPVFAENWDIPVYNVGKFVGHNIIEIIDGDEVLFIDPTYSQIDSSYKGKFAYIKPEEVMHFYGRGKVPIKMYDVTEMMDQYLAASIKAGNGSVIYQDLLPIRKLAGETLRIPPGTPKITQPLSIEGKYAMVN